MSPSAKLNVFLCLIIVMTSCALSAQDFVSNNHPSDTTKTLFSHIKIKTLGLYIAPEAQLSQLAGDFTGFGGGSVMAVVNRKFALGATFQANQNNFTPSALDAKQALFLQNRSVGLRAEYSFSAHKLVHVSLPFTVGFGQSWVDSVRVTRYYSGFDPAHPLGHGSFNDGNLFRARHFSHQNTTNSVFIHPSVNLNLNIFKYGKWFMGIGYRFNVYTDHPASSVYQLSNNDLSGLTWQTGLKLGVFGINLHKKSREIAE
jgi:hypothetical protein